METKGVRFFALFLLCMATTGCPTRTRRTVRGPTWSVPTTGSEQARARFDKVRTQFEQNAEIERGVFQDIVRDFPEDPIVPHALLYAGMSALRAGDAADAVTILSELKAKGEASSVDQGVLARGRLFRGIALVTMENSLPQTERTRAREAVRDLSVGRRAVDQSDDDEIAWWAAAMAGALASYDPAASVPFYDAWWRRGSASERRYVREELTKAVAKLDEFAVQSVYGRLSAKDSVAAAVVGERYVFLLTAAGRHQQAATVLSEISTAQGHLGIAPRSPSIDGGNPDRVGALLPMTGRLNRVGASAMRGLVLASGEFASAAVARDGFELVTRDTHSDATTVEPNLQALVDGDVIAVVGPFDQRSAAQAAESSEKIGVPIVTLAPRGAKSNSGLVFTIRHSAEARARSLARHAVESKKIQDFAIFAPNSAYGKVVGDAFKAEVEALGATVVVTAQYAVGTTSFADDVAKLRKPWSAVFVPDSARVLQLVAPALAAANLNARPRGKDSKHGRSILLLSTAEGINEGFLRTTGRYSWGAVFAPGFFPDRADSLIAPFVSDYEAQFSSAPSSHEAYALDAARVVQAAVERGATTRGQVATLLRGQSVPGLTGTIRFGPDGLRVDLGLLFEVLQPFPDQYELRAIRR